MIDFYDVQINKIEINNKHTFSQSNFNFNGTTKKINQKYFSLIDLKLSEQLQIKTMCNHDDDDAEADVDVDDDDI